ncbi:MAG: DUF1330 domain-containing protein [Bacteroidetes bacterium]|nr:DUF1330 domain-containing protein [Bacteroidota bacterium]MBS1977264.1 DUF1330 domain-containing protein [Bacteroidota bacterium]
MKGYIIVDVKITDPQRYDDYRKLTPGSLKPFDGKFIVRGGNTEVLEGDWEPGRIVVLEFPSLERAKAWWSSDGYAPAKAIRQAASITQMIVVEGYES